VTNHGILALILQLISRLVVFLFYLDEVHDVDVSQKRDLCGTAARIGHKW
jgi:hypothetical protein